MEAKLGLDARMREKGECNSSKMLSLDLTQFICFFSVLTLHTCTQVNPSGWSEGECKGKAGWFPSAYVEKRQRIPMSNVASEAY